MANVETLLQPTVFNMGTDGYHTNAIACRLMISPLEQFLSASYILEYIKREITREMSQSNRPTQIQLIQNSQPNANGVTPLRFATQLWFEFILLHRGLTLAETGFFSRYLNF